MMGKCTITVNRMLLASLLLNYPDQITIERAAKWGDFEDEYFCEVVTNRLPEGNWGHQDIIIDPWVLRFKQDLDV